MDDGTRINKYLANHGYATRKGADALVTSGLVTINGRRAILGDKVRDTDVVVVTENAKTYTYLAYNKPRGVTTEEVKLGRGLFPVGRLDKMSRGLLIVTNDGRITDRLLNPERTHEKEYKVRVREPLPNNFARRIAAGVYIEGYTTREATVNVTGEHTFMIVLTEGKKHQIRRMCETLRLTVLDLERVRIMNVRLGKLGPGHSRALQGAELSTFLSSLGL